jgi:aspartyl-tRNA synthetase
MTFKQRTHTCGELRGSNIGEKVSLNGWINVRRDLGGMIFVDLRDRYGLTQIVFSPQHNPEIHDKAHDLRPEFVLSATGMVRARPEGMANRQMPTGEIEVIVDEFEVLAHSEVPPFEIRDQVDAGEELRLRYRYLDLRRNELQRNLLLRHKVYQIVHRHFDKHGFLEVETPVLMKSTPEGARDYLVPSRVHPGRFYALPQSPQTYKQLLMVAGLDKYFQIVKCFRDEDLRADRQPEFTQIDVEMSFVQPDDIYLVIEELVSIFLREIGGMELTLPLQRMKYEDAMESYGSDKPDLRFGMPIVTLNDVVRNCGFKVFDDALAGGGRVAAVCVPGAGGYSRKQIDELTERARSLGAGGLVWMKRNADGVQSPVTKFLPDEVVEAIVATASLSEGDMLLVVADTSKKLVAAVLGALRLELGQALNLIDPKAHALVWITDFPMYQYDSERQRFVAEHHAFTHPNPEDLPFLESDPGRVHAQCYDLVWNGNEVGSGSIRIHDRDIQERVFSVMGMPREEINEKFGFLLNAFTFGAPPHGGIALGLDRIVAILAGVGSIRDVIAFPKTNSALSLMDNCPSPVSGIQLDELHLSIKNGDV